MRSVLVLMILMSACAPAAAASMRHGHPKRPVVVRPAEDAPVPPGWYKFPGRPPIPPSENRNLDPSNFGGA
ncbi:hypothetical protein G8O24_24610 [Bradyrhizobium sp. INPA01-394B]|uniref:Uncharacterized protein n=1 Tax=Bradyrhizobium campsiandrae TaxID=1729892 RepID=A0ABR7UA89_9BRAD|nr:hypothetical protein [Bradyrhizobium campsiandrae]MBC9880513.1 hypothetical protein [Bradyrhizobium campsiandrae]MBC9980996.1 hypothetical protein [Bradyrhizobium campsiandrae]